MDVREFGKSQRSVSYAEFIMKILYILLLFVNDNGMLQIL
jgi:hypothetical protein